ncbi:MAG: Crp/Fnr family transcriptional regulator [Bacteroidota bacterium]
MIRTNPKLLAYSKALLEREPAQVSITHYKRKEEIMGQGHRYPYVGIIIKGIVKCFINEANGKAFIQEFMTEGMEVGELEFFEKGAATCSVAAVTPVTILEIPHQLFQKLLNKELSFNRLILESLADKVRYKAPRHAFQTSYSLERNIEKMGELYPDFLKVLPKGDIANYLGVSARSLNRALKALREEHG